MWYNVWRPALCGSLCGNRCYVVQCVATGVMWFNVWRPALCSSVSGDRRYAVQYVATGFMWYNDSFKKVVL